MLAVTPIAWNIKSYRVTQVATCLDLPGFQREHATVGIEVIGSRPSSVVADDTEDVDVVTKRRIHSIALRPNDPSP